MIDKQELKKYAVIVMCSLGVLAASTFVIYETGFVAERLYEDCQRIEKSRLVEKTTKPLK